MCPEEERYRCVFSGASTLVLECSAEGSQPECGLQLQITDNRSLFPMRRPFMLPGAPSRPFHTVDSATAVSSNNMNNAPRASPRPPCLTRLVLFALQQAAGAGPPA